MRVLVIAATLVVGCKDTPSQPSSAGTGGTTPAIQRDAASAPTIDWAACEAAVTNAEQLPLAPRAQVLLDGCRVCGDWAPIVHWNTPTAEGGPKRADIEAAMERCDAFCIGEARMKFLGTLDDARGRASRAPWKQLALLCKERVSALPDDRFVDGVYFAYDRIARAAFARGGELATRLETLELPLPVASASGAQIDLPEVDLVGVAGANVQVAVLGRLLTVGKVPQAHLTRDGVRVDLGSDGFPGKTVTAADLGAELSRVLAPYKARTIILLAPAGMRADLLLPVVDVAARGGTVALAARAKESPHGWELAGGIPVMLDTHKGRGSIRVTPEMTVQQLAEQLALQKANPVGIWGP